MIYISNFMNKILKWFHRKYTGDVYKILNYLNDFSEELRPARKLNLRSELVEMRNLTQVKFDQLILTMARAGLIYTEPSGTVALTDRGVQTLQDDQTAILSWLNVMESIFKRNFTALIALIALIVSIFK